MLNDIGDASFTIANNVYLMLLTVATAGIPSTLSKMVSERHALNKPAEARRVYHAALIFAGAAGVVMTLLLYFGAPFYATHIAKQPEAAAAIQALAPALLLFPAIAMMRGYFQGRNNMTAGGISQIIEQIARVLTAIGLAYVLLRLGYDDTWIAAGASFGGVLGSIGAFAVMLYFTVKLRRNDRELKMPAADRSIPLGGIYRDIFTLSIPIVLSSLAVPAVNFIDSSIVKPLLIGQVGLGEATAALAVLGNRAQSVAGIPPILAIALSTSLIPIISAAFARKDQEHLEQQVSLAMRVAILTGMPMVIALCVASYSINGLLFSSLGGSGIIGFLTFGTIFQITMMTTNSILLGIGKAKLDGSRDDRDSGQACCQLPACSVVWHLRHHREHGSLFPCHYDAERQIDQGDCILLDPGQTLDGLHTNGCCRRRDRLRPESGGYSDGRCHAGTFGIPADLSGCRRSRSHYISCAAGGVWRTAAIGA